MEVFEGVVTRGSFSFNLQRNAFTRQVDNDTKHCVMTQIRSSRTTEDGKTGFWSFKDVFFLVSVVPVVAITSFRSFRLFRSFRFGRFGRFGGFVSAFQVLVHACHEWSYCFW